MDGDVALRRGLGSIDVRVVLLEPDFGSIRQRVEEAVIVGAILALTLVDDEANVLAGISQAHPGEAPIIIFTPEGLGRSPVSGLTAGKPVTP